MDIAGKLLGLRTENIEIEGLQCTIRTLTGADRSRVVAANEADKTVDKADSVALMVALSLGDAEGNRVFSDSQIEDVKKLPARVIDFVALRSKSFNYLSAEAIEAAKKV